MRERLFVRKSAEIGFVIFVIAATASAQIPASGNMFVGYSFSRANSVSGTAVSLNGWEGSLEGKFLPWAGIVADFGGGYGSDNNVFTNSELTCMAPCPIHGNSVRRYTYLFGPRVSIPVGRFTPFAHFLFGASHVNASGVTDTSFATAVGGGLDYRLIPGFAWRLQLDNVHTDFFSTSENHIRFSTGVDLRF
jgi:hypothetical protein